jgi:4-amino-4-deoxy-L-arabinose transferase-like glycosyltransferase
MSVVERSPSALSVGATRRISLFHLLVVFGAAAGIGLRAWVLASSQGTLDADEAVYGLMARHVLHGHLTTFFWAQAYGGTQEVLLTAGVFGLFGSSTLALKIVPAVLYAVAAVLVWRVGRRTIGEPGAQVAAVLFWVAPTYFVWKSTRAHGFYGSSLVLGLIVVLMALRLRERYERRDAAVLGIALGLGWWATPQIAILALPAVGWLLWRRPGAARGWPLALVGFLLGAAPWIVANIRHDWYSLHLGADETSKVGHLHNLFAATLPTALGLRLPFSLAWLPGVVVGAALYAGAIAFFVWLLLRRWRQLEPLLVIALVFPVLYYFSPYTWLNTEPRYLVLFAPVVALLAASVLTTFPRAAAGVAVALALSIAGLEEMDRNNLAVFHSEHTTVPSDFGPLLRTLDEHGVRHAYGSYWVAWRITFESREHVIAAVYSARHYARRGGRVVPLDGELGRWPPFFRETVRDPRSAYVFLSAGDFERRLAPVLRNAGYRKIAVRDFDVYLPATAAKSNA